jgi:small subunit ribosomal protein S9
MADNIYVGRRKTSVARVILKEGSGKITVNGSNFEIAFPHILSQEEVLSPFKVTSTLGLYDVTINVDGGGTTGQTQAIRLGISRALIDINPEFKSGLKKEGFLTRDPRMVERKKYGQPKARKRFQFSKR